MRTIRIFPGIIVFARIRVYKAVYPRNLFFSEFAEDFCNSIVKRISAYELRTTNNGTQNSRVRMHKNKIYAPALHELIHYESYRHSYWIISEIEDIYTITTQMVGWKSTAK